MTATAEPPVVLAADEELPEGWRLAPLADLIDHALGGTWGRDPGDPPMADEALVRVIRSTDFRHWARDRGASGAVRIIDRRSLEKRQLRNGDLVLEISGGGPDQPVGRTLVVDDEALRRNELPLVCSNFCRQLRLNASVDPAYAGLFLRSQYTAGAFDFLQTQSTNIKNLKYKEFISSVHLPLPPLDEQRRIVAAVEALLQRVEAARARLARVPEILKRFRQQVLAAACSGALTAEWRTACTGTREADELLRRTLEARNALPPLRARTGADDTSNRRKTATGTLKSPMSPHVPRGPAVPDSWTWATLSQVSRLDQGFAFKSANFAGHGIRLLRGENLEPGALRWNDVRYWPAEQVDGFAPFLVEEGEIILALDRPLISRGLKLARARAHDLPCLLVQRMMRFRMADPRMTDYVYLTMQLPAFVEQIHGTLTGSDLPHITGPNLAAYTFPLPPPPEMWEIVRRVDALFGLAGRVEERVAAAQARAERLTQAVLGRTFRGELLSG